MLFRLLVPLAALVLLVAACGGGGAPAAKPAGPAGNPDNGKTLWTTQAQPTCSTCHMINGQGGSVGPDLSKIGTTAATRKPGMSAEDYIRESIVDPDAFTVQGFSKGLMVSYRGSLNDQQIADLVAYYMTLK